MKSILIVDDTKANRAILNKILSEKYQVLEAENGKEGLQLFTEHKEELAAVILDLVMPVMNGYEFLEEVKKIDKYGDVPILVATGDENVEAEDRCLELGAADFIHKPYHRNTLELRLKNAVSRSHIEYLEKIKYLSERDELTGIYNKKQFFIVTKESLKKNQDTQFALIRLDIDQFRLFNSFFGIRKGDELLKHVGRILLKLRRTEPMATFGRAESDIFLVCLPYKGKEELIEQINVWYKQISSFNENYCFELSMGVYVIDNINIDMETMYAYASTAARKCKNKYMSMYAFYDKSMNETIFKEQLLLNDMQRALDENQFVPYIQPKFNLDKEVPFGGEALVRWIHPTKGLIPPGEFIPIFERNGFIVRLDYFMWETVCKLLRRWIDEGKNPDPISVNMSRMSLYNVHITDNLKDLVTKYDVPPKLLNLEITESAYMDNPELMKKTIYELKQHGFTVMMDDFGSGYSSLNTLKDIDVDILKIDMKFLPTGEVNGKSEKILVSVIRMAGWLGLPVVVEGVETAEQKTFLKNIGAEYIQGYYYYKPMPIDEYEKLVDTYKTGNEAEPKSPVDLENVWEYNPHIEHILKSISIPVGMYEFANGHYKLLRTNKAFVDEFEYGELDYADANSRDYRVSDEEFNKVKFAFQEAIDKRSVSECQVRRTSREDGQNQWYNIKCQYIKSVDDRNMICAVFTNITPQKSLEEELEMVKFSLGNNEAKTTMLVVDDNLINRSMVNSIFSDGYEILEAENGQQALDVLKKFKDKIDIILLDIVMPVMGGGEFLNIKNSDPDLEDIPVVVISADDNMEIQTAMLEKGVNDYVTKPFVPEVMKRRVKNVLEYNSRFRNLVKEFEKASKQDK